MQHDTRVAKDFSPKVLTKLSDNGCVLVKSRRVPNFDGHEAIYEYTVEHTDGSEFTVSFQGVLKLAEMRYK